MTGPKMLLGGVAIVLAVALLVAMQSQHWGLFFLILTAEIGVLAIQVTMGEFSKGFKNIDQIKKD